jgi:S1-C subfamily serine protease
MLTAKITEQPQDDSPDGKVAQPDEQGPADGDAGLLAGVHVMEIPDAHKPLLPPHAHGVMVASVDDSSPAAETLRPSDVIEAIDKVPIHSVAEYEEAVGAVTGQEVLLSICRDRKRSFAVVTTKS